MLVARDCDSNRLSIYESLLSRNVCRGTKILTTRQIGLFMRGGNHIFIAFEVRVAGPRLRPVAGTSNDKVRTHSSFRHGTEYLRMSQSVLFPAPEVQKVG
jgi:hypothetical protein